MTLLTKVLNENF
jgi:hypothetical protein